jgi:Ca-activated chloride channel family protein
VLVSKIEKFVKNKGIVQFLLSLRPIKKRSMRLFIFFLFLLPCVLIAQQDRSLSPYFIISTDSSGELPDFPLKLNAADVTISGVIADVKITQVYINKGKKPLEAIYVFPASTRAAVYAMEMKVGRKNIKAVIREKKVARAEYDSARSQGKTASLLEEERPNIFQMNVANIMPGDSIIVKLFYTELILPENGVYEFVYPTVVGPRYTGKNSSSDFVAPNPTNPGSGVPYTKAGMKPDYDFNMHVRMQSPVPFEFIESSSHKILLSFEEKSVANVLLSPEEKDGGNRDFILRYKLSGASVKTGMMTTESGDEKYFMFMMQPPARVVSDSIPPREYIFVMDVSGSMAGFPIETSKKLLQNLILGLRPTDIFNIVLFAGGSQQFQPVSLPATKTNVDSALAFILKETGSGGTELGAAMNSAMAIPKQNGFSRTIVIATDGYISAEPAVFESIHNHLDSANVFAFGIGTGVNRYLIEGIAFAGNGEPFVAATSTEADSAAEKFRTYISSPVLTKIKVDFGTMDVYDVDPIHIPDLFSDRPIVVTGKYHGKLQGNVTVTGIAGNQQFKSIIPLENVKPEKKNEALKYLWAREKVTLLDYENSFAGNSDSSAIKQITDLGLKYSILTNYTSFVAIYDKVRNKNGVEDSTITEPLPLPKGVKNQAVGYAMLNCQSLSSVCVVAEYDISSVPDIVQIAPYIPRIMYHGFTQVSFPPVITDVDRFYNGGMPGKSLTNGSMPFFPSQFSSRVASTIPLLWISSYSFAGNPTTSKEISFSPEHQSDFTFNTYVHNSSMQLSCTQFGLEEMNFKWKGKIKTNWQSSTQYNQRWLGITVDKNHDSFLDVPLQTGGSVLQNFMYSNSLKKPLSFRNTTFINGSVLTGGQKQNAVSPFQNNDSLIAVFNSAQLTYNITSKNYLIVESSAGWAQQATHIGNQNYFSSAPFGWITTRIENSLKKGNLEAGITTGYSGGKEMLNGERFGKDHSVFSGFSQYNYYGNKINFQYILQFNTDSRYGSWITPGINFNWNNEHGRIGICGRRIRGQEITVGSLLPLLYSARTLSFSKSILPDDGWMGKIYGDMQKHYDNSFRIGVGGGYTCSIYNRMTVIDLDSDPGVIEIYSAGKQPLHHHLILQADFSYRDHFNAQFYYQYLIRSFTYNSGTFASPLLPQHELSGKLFYDIGSPSYDTHSWKFDITGKYFSSQRLPGHGFSKSFATMDFHGEYTLYQWTFSADVLNAFNYRQKIAVYNSQDAWGTGFDASTNWAPVIGRIFQVGVAYKFRARG